MPVILSRYERDTYLIKLQKEFAFAGATIPERIEIDGKEIRLRPYVFETSKKKGHLTPAEQENVDQVTALLRKKRREIVEHITTRDMTGKEAEDLYQIAIGIDRALDTLYRAHEPKSSPEEEARKAKVQEGQRWLNLVKKIYTRDEKNHGGFR